MAERDSVCTLVAPKQTLLRAHSVGYYNPGRREDTTARALGRYSADMCIILGGVTGVSDTEKLRSFHSFSSLCNQAIALANKTEGVCCLQA